MIETILSGLQLDRLGSVHLTSPLVKAGLIRRRRAVSILMYHSVSDQPERGVRGYYRLSTSIDRFREQMHWLKSKGYRVLDLLEAVDWVNSGTSDPNPAVVITFDDGFLDVLENAWPVLSELGFTATIFLPTGYIGNDRRTFKGRECLTWPEVRELRGNGLRFGAHTVTHPALHGLAWSDVACELRESRERIEQELCEKVSSFAYPYAFPQEDAPFAERFRQELACQRYTVGTTTVIGRAVIGSDPLLLKRLPINDCDDLLLFESKVTGAYDWVGAAQLGVRHLKKAYRSTRQS